MRELRELFPITQHMVYLNCAATSPLARPVKEAIDKFVLDQFGRSNQEFFEEWGECEGRVRAKLARLVGGVPDEIALLGNTSDRLATVASGLAWREGDSVVTCSGRQASAWISRASASSAGREVSTSWWIPSRRWVG